jgi:hypothetical protein
MAGDMSTADGCLFYRRTVKAFGEEMPTNVQGKSRQGSTTERNLNDGFHFVSKILSATRPGFTAGEKGATG